MKINNKYETQSFGYGQVLPTGERTWSCVIAPDPMKSALEIATELASGAIEIYCDAILTETVQGFTKLQEYRCDITDGAVSAIRVKLQEPGLKEQLDELKTESETFSDAMDDFLMTILPMTMSGGE